jgi:hypothetical protein
MKPSSWDKQLGLVSPRERAASQSDQTNTPSKNKVRNEVGLDVSHHARISQRGGEMPFFLDILFHRRVKWRFCNSYRPVERENALLTFHRLHLWLSEKACCPKRSW